MSDHESGESVATGGLSLMDRTALITGSSRGLGWAIARRLAAHGAHTILHGPDDAQVRAARERLQAELPSADLSTVTFDLADPEAIDSGFDRLEAVDAMPDVLVNNAAMLDVGSADFLEQPRSYFRDLLEVNLMAVHHCSLRAARLMAARGSGTIVSVSSLAGERPIHGRPAYNTSKAAVEGLTRAMALELAPHGIAVNSIAPGYVLTERWASLTPDTVRTRTRNAPTGAPTTGAEIGDLIAFLASGRTPSLIGARIAIDGGLGIQQLPPDVTV